MAEGLLAESIQFNYLPTSASFQFLKDQETRLLASAKVVQVLQPELSALHTALAFFDSELKRSAKNLKTDDVDEADKAMDNAYTGFKETARCMALYPPTAEIGSALKRVNQKVKDYKIDTTTDMNAEMALIANLLTDLEGTLASDIALLGLSAWVTRLRSTYETLHTLVFERTNENALTAPRQLSQARLSAEDAYRKLLQMLNAHILIEGDAEYRDCVLLLNGEVTHYNQTIIARRKPAGSGSSSGSSSHGQAASPDPSQGGQASPDPSQGGENGGQQTGGDNNQGGGTGTIDTGGTGGGSTGGGTTGGDNGGSTGGGDNGGGGGTGSIVIDNPENDGGD